MPRKHDPTEAMWRGLPALLPYASEEIRAGGPARWRPPGLVRWLAELEGAGKLPGQLVSLRAVGIEYGSNESVFDDVVSDAIVLPAFFLAADGAHHVQTAVDGVESARQSVLALGRFARNLALAAGGSDESSGAEERAAGEAYARIDPLFRSWIITLVADSEPAERSAAWQRVLYFVLTDLASGLSAAAGPAALVGRAYKGQFRDAGLAESWFRRQLREALPHAFTERTAEIDDVREVTV